MTPEEYASILIELKTLLGVVIQRGEEDRRASLIARDKINDIHSDQVVAHSDFVAHLEADDLRFKAVEQSMSLVDKKASEAGISKP